MTRLCSSSVTQPAWPSCSLFFFSHNVCWPIGAVVARLPPELLYQVICCHPVQSTAVLPRAVPLVRQQETMQAAAQEDTNRKKALCVSSDSCRKSGFLPFFGQQETRILPFLGQQETRFLPFSSQQETIKAAAGDRPRKQSQQQDISAYILSYLESV